MKNSALISLLISQVVSAAVAFREAPVVENSVSSVHVEKRIWAGQKAETPMSFRTDSFKTPKALASENGQAESEDQAQKEQDDAEMSMIIEIDLATSDLVIDDNNVGEDDDSGLNGGLDSDDDDDETEDESTGEERERTGPIGSQRDSRGINRPISDPEMQSQNDDNSPPEIDDADSEISESDDDDGDVSSLPAEPGQDGRKNESSQPVRGQPAAQDHGQPETIPVKVTSYPSTPTQGSGESTARATRFPSSKRPKSKSTGADKQSSGSASIVTGRNAGSRQSGNCTNPNGPVNVKVTVNRQPIPLNDGRKSLVSGGGRNITAKATISRKSPNAVADGKNSGSTKGMNLKVTVEKDLKTQSKA